MAPGPGTQPEEPPGPLRCRRGQESGSSPTHPGKSEGLATSCPPQPLASEVRSQQARARERERRNLHTLPAGTQNGAAASANSLKVPPMIRCELTAWSSNPIPRNEHTGPHKNVPMNAQNSISQHRRQVETTQMSVHEPKEEQSGLQPHRGLGLGHGEAGSPDTHCNMDGP